MKKIIILDFDTFDSLCAACGEKSPGSAYSQGGF